jgi:xanthine dehydrogenase iron-sulfur cluster and FAD-binding subunit A
MLTVTGITDKVPDHQGFSSGARRRGGTPVQVPAPFDYVRATSVAQTLELLERHGPESRVIAGGHSLLPMMKLRLARPEWLIDINDVAEMRHVTEEADVLRIGRSPGTRRCSTPTSSGGCSRSSTTPRR